MVVPPHEVRFFEVGETIPDPMDGDIWLVKHPTLFADAIVLGQKVLELSMPELRGFTWCDHNAYCRGGLVSEMGPRGYERCSVLDYDAEVYAVARLDVDAAAISRANSFDEACGDVGYGWIEYLPIIIDGLTNSEFSGSWGDAIMCSTHVSMVAMAMGLFPTVPPSRVVPAQMAQWFGAAH